MQQRRNTKLLVIFTIFMLLLVFTFSKNSLIAEESNENLNSGRVLFISSYSYGWDTVQIQIEGIKEGIGKNVVLDYEFMDTKRVDDETSNLLFYEGLKYRMSKVEPYDAVILGDDAALNFALKYRDELFKEIPLIFEGVNNEELALEVSKDPLITGVLEKLSFEKNIDFAKSIFPNADKVVGIFDNTVTGEAERKQFYKNAQMYPDLKFSEINTSLLTTKELVEAIESVEDNTILIYVVMTEDASGKNYTNSQSVSLISRYAKVPAFRMVSGGIAEGLLGGNIVSMELSGKIAGEMAMEVIGGKSLENFDVMIDSPNVYCVNEDVMRKFNIDLSLIPEGAEVLNHKETFIEKYEEAIMPVIAILILLAIIIFMIMVDNIKRRKIARELESARRNLEHINHHDLLTGLSNRNKFNEDLPELIENKIPCAIMMIDIDNFKNINDTYGHNNGDEALKQIGLRLQRLSSYTLQPYRFAGDEFIVIIKSDDKNVIDECANVCMKAFEEPFRFNGKLHDVKVSIGISINKENYTMLNLIGYADSAMYNVKKSGKNSYAYYDGISSCSK